MEGNDMRSRYTTKNNHKRDIATISSTISLSHNEEEDDRMRDENYYPIVDFSSHDILSEKNEMKEIEENEEIKNDENEEEEKEIIIDLTSSSHSTIFSQSSNEEEEEIDFTQEEENEMVDEMVDDDSERSKRSKRRRERRRGENDQHKRNYEKLQSTILQKEKEDEMKWRQGD